MKLQNPILVQACSISQGCREMTVFLIIILGEINAFPSLQKKCLVNEDIARDSVNCWLHIRHFHEGRSSSRVPSEEDILFLFVPYFLPNEQIRPSCLRRLLGRNQSAGGIIQNQPCNLQMWQYGIAINHPHPRLVAMLGGPKDPAA